VLLQVSWKEVEGDPTGGVHLSVEGREEAIPFRVKTMLGHGPVLRLGRKVCPGLLYIFLFSFHFLIYFITFAN
jgi:hypothetical protein